MGTDGGLQRWLADLIPAYDDIGEQIPFYLEGSGGKRAEYPGNMVEGELLEGLKKENATYDAFARDIAVLNIYFGEPEFPEYERTQRMTWFGFLSNVGGLCGLCLGFSLISGIEIIYWFILRLTRAIRSKQKREEGKTFGFAADLRN